MPSDALSRKPPAPLIYIAGPFRAPTWLGVRRHVERVRDLGLLIAEAGGYPIMPHTMTAEFDGLLTDQFWLDGTLELLTRCDGLVLLPTWQASRGARAEQAWAVDAGMPWLVAETLDMLPRQFRTPALRQFIEALWHLPRGRFMRDRLQWTGFHKAGCPRIADCTCNQIAP